MNCKQTVAKLMTFYHKMQMCSTKLMIKMLHHGSILASMLMLALNHFFYITNMVFVEGVNCPLFHIQYLSTFSPTSQRECNWLKSMI